MAVVEPGSNHPICRSRRLVAKILRLAPEVEKHDDRVCQNRLLDLWSFDISSALRRLLEASRGRLGSRLIRNRLFRARETHAVEGPGRIGALPAGSVESFPIHDPERLGLMPITASTFILH
jgi:hypothetical protein